MATGPQNSPMEEREQRRGSRMSFQIFPEPTGDADRLREGQYGDSDRERLPSIVVEPTEVRAEESGEISWPCQASYEDEEDPFQDQCVPQSNFPNKAGNGEDMTSLELRTRHFKHPYPVASTQIDFTRLTPPPSPTSLEVAPPCYKN